MSALYSGGTALHGEAPHTGRKVLGVIGAGDVVGGLGKLDTVGDDGAYQGGGLSAGAAAHDMHTRDVGVFVVAFARHSLV